MNSLNISTLFLSPEFRNMCVYADTSAATQFLTWFVVV